MKALLLLLALLGQAGTRPATLPPLAELADKSSVISVDSGLIFAPDLGGLLLTGNAYADDVSLSRASDSGLRVNLRTGELCYVAAPDLFDRQLVCPTAVFVRSYRSELAKSSKHSPGLPDGWIHNYDLIVKLPEDKDKWQPVTLTYPDKAQELIEPELGEDGKPTGKGRSLSNATYDVTLVPGDAVNTYKSIDITWPNSGVEWSFEPHVSGVLVLRSITQGDVPRGSVRLSYYPDRTLAFVRNEALNMTLLSFVYSNGLLETTVCRSEYSVSYAYNQLNGNTVLWKVSEPFKDAAQAADGFVFSYANELAYPALAQIAIPSGAGWSKSHVEYTNGHISAIQGASGVRQEVGSGR